MGDMSKPMKRGSAAEAYQRGHQHSRSQFLDRARHNASLTIPSLMPLDGHDGKAHLYETFQGLGAAGVVHLSSRLVMALLPAGRPHMRFDLPPQAVLANDGDVPKDLEIGLALAERLVQQEVEDKGWRPSTLMALQQDLVAGNHLEHQLEDDQIRVFRMDRYTVRRDWAGHPLEIILKETLTPDTLPPEVTPPAGKDQWEEIDLYTWIRRQDDVYVVRQELGDGTSVGPTLKFSPEALPYNAVRWSKTPGEDWGRSFIEEHAADLRTLEGITKAEIEMAAMASRNFIAVRPGAVGAALKRRLIEAVNGDVVFADPEAVELKSFDNASGFQLVNLKTQQLTEQLSRAFLLFSAGQRNAERVTATEIERDIQELEAALGGNFSTLNTDMMERRTKLLMQNMERRGALPPGLLGSGVRPTVLTGLEALSRERDVTRVQQLAGIVQMFGETAIDTLKLNKILARATIGLGFADVIRTDDEIAKKQQERQEAEMAKAAAGPVASAAVQQQGQQQEEG